MTAYFIALVHHVLCLSDQFILFFRKLIVTKLVKKLLFMERRCALPCSQESTVGITPVSIYSHFHTLKSTLIVSSLNLPNLSGRTRPWGLLSL
jgi:hypothetical protein